MLHERYIDAAVGVNCNLWFAIDDSVLRELILAQKQEIYMKCKRKHEVSYLAKISTYEIVLIILYNLFCITDLEDAKLFSVLLTEHTTSLNGKNHFIF